jgi:sulfite oxidase
MLTRL